MAGSLEKIAIFTDINASAIYLRILKTKPHSIYFLPQYQRQRKCFLFFFERELKKALRERLTRAALSGILSTTAN